MHITYRAAALEAGVRAVGISFFSNTFHELNFSVFVPRKDQCDVCTSAKHGNTDGDTLEKHIRAKDLARTAKTQDKERASGELSVWTMDLQAVLLCPKTKTSAMYYRTKLQVHNFTLFNLLTKEGYCYCWDETDGNLSSEMFAYLQFSHFSQVLDNNPAIKEIIVWSDGCGYQNRNAVVSNAYLDLAVKRYVKITQKYLVPGHTQMECDSMHSTIERKLGNYIFVPRDYIVLMEAARIRPSP